MPTPITNTGCALSAMLDGADECGPIPLANFWDWPTFQKKLAISLSLLAMTILCPEPRRAILGIPPDGHCTLKPHQDTQQLCLPRFPFLLLYRYFS